MNRIEKKLIKNIFGIQGPVDERALAIIGRASMYAVLGILIFEVIVDIVGIALPIYHDETAFEILLMIQFMGVISIIIGTICLTIGRSGLNHQEVTPEKYSAALKRIQLKTIWCVTLTIINVHVIEALLSLKERALLTSLTSPRQLLQTIVFGSIFCPLIYWIAKRNLKVVYVDD